MGITYQVNSDASVKVILIIVGLLFAVVGIIIIVSSKAKSKRCTETVMAEVVDNITSVSYTDKRPSTTYKPVFSFTYDGKSYQFNSNTSANPPVFQVGEIVELKVNPDNPADFYAEKDKVTKILSMAFTAIGVLLTIVGIVIEK